MSESVVIFGVGKGFGFSIAKKFGEAGKTPILVARNADQLKQFVKDLSNDGIKADFIVADVTDPTQITNVFSKVKMAYGIPETMVYNVGDKTLDTPFSLPLDQIKGIYDTNVFGAITTTRQFVGLSDDSKLNRNILITGGGAAFHPTKDNVTLAATKAALSDYAFSLHDAVEDDNIYVGLITIQGLSGSSEEMQPDNVAKVYVKAAQDRSEREIKYPAKPSDF